MTLTRAALALLALALLVEGSIRPAVALAPPRDVVARDTPNDAGGSVTVRWKISPNDGASPGFLGYRVERSSDPRGPWHSLAELPGLFVEHIDSDGVKDGASYYYRVISLSASVADTLPGAESSTDPTDGIQPMDPVAGPDPDQASSGGVSGEASSEPVGPAVSSAQWLHTGRINMLIAVLILSGLVVFYIERARQGRPIFIRKIAGLDAVDEAVGRATEMGRNVLFVPGTQDMDNVQTLAGISILGRVARLTAQYETPLDVPVSRSLVMVASRETVKEAYLSEGRPDSYHDDCVYYLTDDQFGYAAAVDGIIVRERPATIFMQGCFYAESLILAETGNAVGAIQIAGTAQPSQLPFFVAACDYTLIGEELFVASAYLSREPRQLGSLKGQDVGKAIILVILLVGIFLQTSRVLDVAALFDVR